MFDDLLMDSGSAISPVSKSLRFNSANSGYMYRTPGSASNRKTWTFSCWVKKLTNGSATQQGILGVTATYVSGVRFQPTDDTIAVQLSDGSSYWLLVTNAQYKDTNAWLHIVVAVDTTQATASNRCKLYVNGVEITDFGTDQRSSIVQNCDTGINSTNAHNLGLGYSGGSWYINGYLADAHLIDGQQLTPSSFGQAGGSGWIPKSYSGSYSTNGFHLTFNDNSSVAALGTDSSGNGNTMTVSGILTTDQSTDVPS